MTTKLYLLTSALFSSFNVTDRHIPLNDPVCLSRMNWSKMVKNSTHNQGHGQAKNSLRQTLYRYMCQQTESLTFQFSKLSVIKSNKTTSTCGGHTVYTLTRFEFLRPHGGLWWLNDVWGIDLSQLGMLVPYHCTNEVINLDMTRRGRKGQLTSGKRSVPFILSESWRVRPKVNIYTYTCG